MLANILINVCIIQIYCLSLQHQTNNSLKPKTRKGAKIMKIQDVINEIRNNQLGVLAIVLKDASRYASNSRGEMTWNGTLFTKAYPSRRAGDEVIKTGNKETNVSEVERVLSSLIGKGEVSVRLMGKWFSGEVEA